MKTNAIIKILDSPTMKGIRWEGGRFALMSSDFRLPDELSELLGKDYLEKEFVKIQRIFSNGCYCDAWVVMRKGKLATIFKKFYDFLNFIVSKLSNIEGNLWKVPGGAMIPKYCLSYWLCQLYFYE